MIANLDQLCKAFAPVFKAFGQPAPTPNDILDMVVREEEERVASINRVLHATQNARHERHLLRDEKGSAYGEVVAEIPTQFYMNLMKDKRFGRKAVESKEGIKEIARCFPGVRVKTVGAKVHRGHAFKPRRSSARFMPGTIQFAS